MEISGFKLVMIHQEFGWEVRSNLCLVLFTNGCNYPSCVALVAEFIDNEF